MTHFSNRFNPSKADQVLGLKNAYYPLKYGTFGPDFNHFDCFELDVRGHK